MYQEGVILFGIIVLVLLKERLWFFLEHFSNFQKKYLDRMDTHKHTHWYSECFYNIVQTHLICYFYCTSVSMNWWVCSHLKLTFVNNFCYCPHIKLQKLTCYFHQILWQIMGVLLVVKYVMFLQCDSCANNCFFFVCL